MVQRHFPATGISSSCCPALFLHASPPTGTSNTAEPLCAPPPPLHLTHCYFRKRCQPGRESVVWRPAAHRSTAWARDEEFHFIRAIEAHLIQTAMSLLPVFLHYFFLNLSAPLYIKGRKKKRNHFFPPELIPIHRNERNAMFWAIKAGKWNYFLHHSNGNEA